MLNKILKFLIGALIFILLLAVEVVFLKLLIDSVVYILTAAICESILVNSLLLFSGLLFLTSVSLAVSVVNDIFFGRGGVFEGIYGFIVSKLFGNEGAQDNFIRINGFNANNIIIGLNHNNAEQRDAYSHFHEMMYYYNELGVGGVNARPGNRIDFIISNGHVGNTHDLASLLAVKPAPEICGMGLETSENVRILKGYLEDRNWGKEIIKRYFCYKNVPFDDHSMSVIADEILTARIDRMGNFCVFFGINEGDAKQQIKNVLLGVFREVNDERRLGRQQEYRRDWNENNRNRGWNDLNFDGNAFRF